MGWANGARIAALRDLVVATYGPTCHLCGVPIDLSLSGRSRWAFSIDHLVPRSRGGGDELSNLRPSHYGCNCRKSDGRLRRGPGRRAAAGVSYLPVAVSDWLAAGPVS